MVGGDGALSNRAIDEALGRFLCEAFDSLDHGCYGLHRHRERERENLGNGKKSYMKLRERVGYFGAWGFLGSSFGFFRVLGQGF